MVKGLTVSENEKQEVENIEPKRGKWVLRDGKWQPGSAAPELLREDLRSLPADLVTKDIADQAKVHELDPEHIREALKDEYAEAQQKQGKSYVPPARNALNQKIIDLQRLKIMRHLLENYANGDERALEMKHLWYERNDDRIYGMRPGPAPMPGKREPHLRGFDLNLDFNKLPELLKKAESYAREDKPAAGNDDDWGD